MKTKKILSSYPSNFITNQEGSILVTVLSVIAILLMIFLFAMTFAVSRFSEYHKDNFKLQSSYLADAAIARAIANLSDSLNLDISYQEIPKIGYYESIVYPWGLQNLIFAKGYAANQSTTKWALLGSYTKDYFEGAVTVANEQFPLVIAGQSNIFGDVYCGKLGLQTGSIQGRAADREYFHKGEIITNNNIQFPNISLNKYNEFIDIIKQDANNYLYGSYQLNSENREVLNEATLRIENNLEIKNLHWMSFDTIYSIFVDGSVLFSYNNNMDAYLQIIAEGSVKISSDNILNHILIYSRDTIFIGDNTVFSGTAISEKAVIVKDSAQLRYPSVIITTKSQEEEKVNPIQVNSPHEQETSLFLLSSDTLSLLNQAIFIDSNVTINGIVYSEGTTELRGLIKGSLFVEQFTLELPPTTYVNWLYNVNINRAALNFIPVLPFSSDEPLFNNGHIIEKVSL